jgi:predicted amidohydrolase YtcJ
MVRNFDPSLQTGPASIGFAELDAVSREHPVFVLNASGHLAHAGRHAFAVTGIAEGVMNPEGAEFVRDGSGRLSGVIRNNPAFSKELSADPAVKNADPVKALIGRETVKRLVRARSVGKAGIVFSLHSDFTLTDPNSLHMIRRAMTRRTWQERQFVLAPGERVSVASAIHAVTAEAVKDIAVLETWMGGEQVFGA